MRNEICALSELAEVQADDLAAQHHAVAREALHEEVFVQLVDSQRAQHVDVGEQRAVHIAVVHPSIGEQQRVGPVLKAEHVTVGRCLIRIEHGEELALHTPKHLTAGHIDLHAVGQRVHLRQLPIAIEVTIV